MCVSITNEILEASLTFPAASCCVATIECAPSPSGCGGMQAQAPPAETVAWQSTVVVSATVMTASGSPVPKNGILVLLVGVGTAASVGFAIDVFTLNANPTLAAVPTPTRDRKSTRLNS